MHAGENRRAAPQARVKSIAGKRVRQDYETPRFMRASSTNLQRSTGFKKPGQAGLFSLPILAPY